MGRFARAAATAVAAGALMVCAAGTAGATESMPTEEEPNCLVTTVEGAVSDPAGTLTGALEDPGGTVTTTVTCVTSQV